MQRVMYLINLMLISICIQIYIPPSIDVVETRNEYLKSSFAPNYGICQLLYDSHRIGDFLFFLSSNIKPGQYVNPSAFEEFFHFTIINKFSINSIYSRGNIDIAPILSKYEGNLTRFDSVKIVKGEIFSLVITYCTFI